MKTFIHIKWIDLSYDIQLFIMREMLVAFNKSHINHTIHDFCDQTNKRFSKHSCMVDLYYDNWIMKGVCIYWNTNRFVYLDKLFSIDVKTKGIGSHMLNAFIDKWILHNTNHKHIVWRTNPDTCLFYLKDKRVIKYFNTKQKNKELVYLGVGRQSWEYEDIYELIIPSCFETL